LGSVPSRVKYSFATWLVRCQAVGWGSGAGCDEVQGKSRIKKNKMR
jgi:hypothetical protein